MLEEAHQQLMRALWCSGQRSAALAQHATCRRILAEEQRAAFTAGVAFVPLAPLGSDAFLVPAIAEAVRLTFASQPDPKVQLLNYLQEQELLLLLDNFEPLLTGAGLLGDLLQHAPG